MSQQQDSTASSEKATALLTIDHVRAAALDGRFEGIIVGRALYDGRFTLAEALAAC